MVLRSCLLGGHCFDLFGSKNLLLFAEVLLCGYPPFFGETDADVLAKVDADVLGDQRLWGDPKTVTTIKAYLYLNNVYMIVCIYIYTYTA